MIAILIDMSKAGDGLDGAMQSEQDFYAAAVQQDGSAWDFYRAGPDMVKGPVKNWPSGSDLQNKWVKLQQYSPGEAVQASRELAEDL